MQILLHIGAGEEDGRCSGRVGLDGAVLLPQQASADGGNEVSLKSRGLWGQGDIFRLDQRGLLVWWF